MRVSRNSACPCGSGLKYKRCCLVKSERRERERRFDEAVGRRIQKWSSESFKDEVGAALEEFAGAERSMDDDDLQIFAVWFHNDRELPGGGTPAERYARRGDLPEDERAAARIASAGLGIHRVLAVEPGESLVLEDLVRGTRTEVYSQAVSREVVRWDILIGRVMDGDPPSLWGPARFLQPADELELVAELERLAGASDEQALSRALRERALDLMRFQPPSWSVEPSLFTLEGDPVAQGSATWRVRDVRVARERIRALGGLAPDEPTEIDITISRKDLVTARPALPAGAIVLEAGPVDDLDRVPVATLQLEGSELRVETMSAQRLERAIEIVELDFGDVAELSDQDVVSIERMLAERGSEHESTDPAPEELPPSAEERRLVGDAMTARMRLWLDEPHPQLDGRTPRQAAGTGERHDELLRVVRAIENGAGRARRDGEPAADVAWMRHELGLEDSLAA